MNLHPPEIDNRKPIGIDIDNVVAATDLKIRQLIKQYFGISSNQSDITNWHYHLSLPITSQDEQFIFDNFHDRDCMGVRLLNGASLGLKQLSCLFQIYLITSRPPSSEKITKEWLHKKQIAYKQIYFLQQKVILAPQLNFVIEDRLDTALSFAEQGVKVFLFDYPWNQYPPHPDIIRVKKWFEVVDSIQLIYSSPITSVQ